MVDSSQETREPAAGPEQEKSLFPINRESVDQVKQELSNPKTLASEAEDVISNLKRLGFSGIHLRDMVLVPPNSNLPWEYQIGALTVRKVIRTEAARKGVSLPEINDDVAYRLTFDQFEEALDNKIDLDEVQNRAYLEMSRDDPDLVNGLIEAMEPETNRQEYRNGAVTMYQLYRIASEMQGLKEMMK